MVKTAFLILTTKCTRRCPYCFYETGVQARGDEGVFLPVRRDLMTTLAHVGVKTVILSGGEPLLHPDLTDVTRAAHERRLYSVLLSNGDRLTDQRLAELVDAGLCAMSLSLDGLTGGRLTKAPWRRVETAAAIRELNTCVITPVSRENLGILPEIIDRIHALNLFVLLQPVYIPDGHALFKRLSLSAATLEERRRFAEILNQWISLYGVREYGALLHGLYGTGPLRRPACCAMGRDAVVIDANGDAMPCFHRRDLIAGNVLDEDPERVILNVFERGREAADARCFGEHCVSLFAGS